MHARFYIPRRLVNKIIRMGESHITLFGLAVTSSEGYTPEGDYFCYNRWENGMYSIDVVHKRGGGLVVLTNYPFLIESLKGKSIKLDWLKTTSKPKSPRTSIPKPKWNRGKRIYRRSSKFDWRNFID